MFNGDIKLTNVIFRYDKSVQAQIDDITIEIGSRPKLTSEGTQRSIGNLVLNTPVSASSKH